MDVKFLNKKNMNHAHTVMSHPIGIFYDFNDSFMNSKFKYIQKAKINSIELFFFVY